MTSLFNAPPPAPCSDRAMGPVDEVFDEHDLGNFR